ncbi:anion permease [Streptomyces achromogenes]|uniref:anion permease n=1 Tax=Streptomyces achromogenes TaxID=67255 RepID=UPI00358F7F76
MSSLYGGLTHYASGPAPVLFGAGYVTLAEWWRTGLIAAGANLVIWMGVGALGLKVLGHW